VLFSGKILSYVAARLRMRYWVPYLLWLATNVPLFATICHYSRLCATIRTIRDYSYYSLFTIRDYLLFTIRDYSLFAIRVFQTPQGTVSFSLYKNSSGNCDWDLRWPTKVFLRLSSACYHCLPDVSIDACKNDVSNPKKKQKPPQHLKGIKSLWYV